MDGADEFEPRASGVFVVRRSIGLQDVDERLFIASISS
jgi:hypothetical protein